jgi:hypothetical protein
MVNVTARQFSRGELMQIDIPASISSGNPTRKWAGVPIEALDWEDFCFLGHFRFTPPAVRRDLLAEIERRASKRRGFRAPARRRSWIY